MGFICNYDGQHYSGQKPILVPTEFRRVEYRYYSESIDRRTKQKEKFFERSSSGFEILKEVNIASSNFDKFKVDYTPKFVESKVVDVIVPRKEVEKPVFNYDEDE